MKPTWLDRALVEAPFCYTLATDETLFHKALTQRLLEEYERQVKK